MLIEPNASALLVIDMQRDFLDSRGYAAKAGLDVNLLRTAIRSISALLAAARKRYRRRVNTQAARNRDR